MNENKVAVPPRKAPANPSTQGPVQTGGMDSVDGFGRGGPHSSTHNPGRPVTVSETGRGAVRGFSGGAVKPGKA